MNTFLVIYLIGVILMTIIGIIFFVIGHKKSVREKTFHIITLTDVIMSILMIASSWIGLIIAVVASFEETLSDITVFVSHAPKINEMDDEHFKNIFS